MKKLLVILQVIGLVAICPVYVALEMTHAPIEISDKPSIKMESVSVQVPEDAKSKIQSSTLDLIVK